MASIAEHPSPSETVLAEMPAGAGCSDSLATMVVRQDTRIAPQEDKYRCNTALRVSGSTFTDSWDHLAAEQPATRARKLSDVAAVVRLLDEMEVLDEAYTELRRQHQEHARGEKEKVRGIIRRSKAERDEYERRAKADAAELEREAAAAEAAGKPGQAEIYRILAATVREAGIPLAKNMGGITESHAEVATLLLDFDAIGALLGDLQRARGKGRATRLRARWVNPLVIGLVGLLAGVVATQIVQDEVADFGSFLPWVVAVVAWALLDYFVEPRLRVWLAQLQLKHMREEVALAFTLWNSLAVVDPAPGDAHPLPAWAKLRENIASLPASGL
jgi:hypothetical protein